LQNRSAVFIFKPDPGFEIVIAIIITIEKPIRINQDPVFILPPDRDFSGKMKKKNTFRVRAILQNTFASE
jgi:hypothetical protein